MFLRFWLSLEGAFYFGLGVFLGGEHKWKCFYRFGTVLGCTYLVAGVTLSVLHAYWMGKPFHEYTLVLAIPLLMYGAWLVIPNYEWPKWLVSLAFPVFIFHIFALSVMRFVANVVHWPREGLISWV